MRVEVAFERLEMGLQGSGGDAASQTKTLAPILDHVLGHPVDDGGVHHCAPADAAPLQKRNVRSALNDLRARVAEHPLERVIDSLAELARFGPWPLFHEDDGGATLGQHVRRHGSGCAGTYDDGVKCLLNVVR